MIVKPTHLVLQPGKNIGSTTYIVELDTVDTSTKTRLNKQTTLLEVTGTYGFWPNISLDPASQLVKAIWQLIVSFGGRMDVVASITDDVAISVNNPTFGYPYTVFVEGSAGRSDRYNYYADESHEYTDSKGRIYSITRHEDSSNCKEFTVVVNN